MEDTGLCLVLRREDDPIVCIFCGRPKTRNHHTKRTEIGEYEYCYIDHLVRVEPDE